MNSSHRGQHASAGCSMPSREAQRLMDQAPRYGEIIEAGARRIRELHKRTRETFRGRDTKEGRKAWEAASAEFHAAYDALAFPGGYESGLRSIQQGDADAIEAALVFLELRPYFFRSQYMRKKFIRLLRHAVLTADQTRRLELVRA